MRATALVLAGAFALILTFAGALRAEPAAHDVRLAFTHSE